MTSPPDLKPKKRGRGRPRRHKAERSVHTISLRLSDEELKEIEQSAEVAGITRSELVRRRVMGQPITPAPGYIDYQLLLTLKTLTQQLRTLGQTTPQPPTELLNQVTACVRQVLKQSP